MMRATYNITDDRLRFYPGAERLSPEHYAEAKRHGFQWWPGQKIFVKIWTPEAEDFLKGFGLEIEEDDEGDDVAARVERFEKYAENAEAAAAGVEARADAGRLNTERRERLAMNVLQRETERAQHWRDRIAGAIRHAARKDSPHVILGRIKKLEALRKKQTKPQQHAEERRRKWEAVDSFESAAKLAKMTEGDDWQKTRAGWIERHTVTILWAGRWVAHCAARIEYERAYLEATGGGEVAAMASGAVKIEKGGAVKGCKWPLKDGLWYTVTKVNPNTIEVFDSFASWGNFPKIPREFVTEHKTAAEAMELAKTSEVYRSYMFPAGATVRGFLEKRNAEVVAQREAARAARNVAA